MIVSSYKVTKFWKMICQLNKNDTSCFYLVETKKIDEHLFVYEGHYMPTASIISWRKEVLKGI